MIGGFIPEHIGMCRRHPFRITVYDVNPKIKEGIFPWMSKWDTVFGCYAFTTYRNRNTGRRNVEIRFKTQPELAAWLDKYGQHIGKATHRKALVCLEEGQKE